MGKDTKQTTAAEAAADVSTEATAATVTEETTTDAVVEETTIDSVVEETTIDSVGTSEKLLIKFTKSPTGTFNLAYNEGDEAEFSMAQAAELIEAGYAIAVGTEA
jgi:hypothetical protein